jgi:hypothetical protein
MESAMEGFAFSMNPPSDPDVLMMYAVRLFRQVYSHRLSSGTVFEPGYDVWELIRDDTVVKAAFRLYTESGVLSTPIEHDVVASDNHLQAVLNAVSQSGEFQITGEIWMTPESLNSEGLSLRAIVNPPEPAPPATTPPPGPAKDVVKCLIDQSLIRCLSDKGLYWPDIGSEERKSWPPTQPDFDCDDFTQALLAWLRNRLKDDYNIKHSYSYHGARWQCKKTDADGNVTWKDHSHGIGFIEIEGSNPRQFLIIDAQSGQVWGPFESMSDEEYVRLVLQLLREAGYDSVCRDEELKPDPVPIRRKPYWEKETWPKENPPWWKDCELPDNDPRKNDPTKDMCKRLRNRLEECCTQRPPSPCGTGPGSSVTPCDGTDPYKWVAGTDGDYR